MRILQVASSLYSWGGIERYVTYLAEGLRARGHEVRITCPPNSPLAKRLPALPIATRGKLDQKAFVAYLRLFKRERFDLVHVHFSPDFLTAGIAAKLRRQRTVLSRHVALPWSPFKVRLYTSVFDHVIPVSEAVQRKLLASGFPAAKMTVARAGCPVLSPLAPAELGAGFHVGAFGRLASEKGLDWLLEAAKQVPEATFHLFGKGPAEAELRAIGGPNVLFHGFVDDVAGPMAAVDVVSIPSRCEEAFPYAALEAMSLGKPLVASRTGGLPEIVRHQETGLLFERGDVHGLAQYIRRLSSDMQLVEKMRGKASELHRSEFTVERMAERIEAVYRAVA